MRLTEPGIYVSRDGRVAVSYVNSSDELYFATRLKYGTLDRIPAGDESTEGDWQRIDLDAVKWPDLPPKPPQCLVRSNGVTSWRVVRRERDCLNSIVRDVDAWMFEVVPHPDNDPEAVAMIEAARKEASDANT